MVSEPLPKFIEDSNKGIEFKRETQQQSKNKNQFDRVKVLVQSNSNKASFLKWSEIVDPDWESPELCQSALVTNKFVSGHWPYLLNMTNKFKKSLEVFLKSIFID